MHIDALAPHFQIELSQDGRMDAMTVHVEALSGSAGPEARDAAAAALTQRIKDAIGVTVAVEVHDPEGVARSQGKAVRVIDNRPKP